MDKKTFNFTSKAIASLTQNLDKEIKELETNLQQKSKVKTSLVKAIKVIENSLIEFSEVVKELQTEEIEQLKKSFTELFEEPFNLEENIFSVMDKIAEEFKVSEDIIKRDKVFRFLDDIAIQCQKEIREGDSLSNVSKKYLPELENIKKGNPLLIYFGKMDWRTNLFNCKNGQHDWTYVLWDSKHKGVICSRCGSEEMPEGMQFEAGNFIKDYRGCDFNLDIEPEAKLAKS